VLAHQINGVDRRDGRREDAPQVAPGMFAPGCVGRVDAPAMRASAQVFSSSTSADARRR
jgi:hypothetical protein